MDSLMNEKINTVIQATMAIMLWLSNLTDEWIFLSTLQSYWYSLRENANNVDLGPQRT